MNFEILTKKTPWYQLWVRVSTQGPRRQVKMRRPLQGYLY